MRERDNPGVPGRTPSESPQMQSTTISPVERRMAFRLLEIIALLLPVLAMLVQIILTRNITKTSGEESKPRLEASVNSQSARSEISFEPETDDPPTFRRLISFLAISVGAALLVWSAWRLLGGFAISTDIERTVSFVRVGIVAVGIAVVVISAFSFLGDVTTLLRRIKRRVEPATEGDGQNETAARNAWTRIERKVKGCIGIIDYRGWPSSDWERSSRNTPDETETDTDETENRTHESEDERGEQ